MTAGEFRKGALAATRQRITDARAALKQNSDDAVALEALSMATEILAKHGWTETPKKRLVQAKKDAVDEKNKGQTAPNQSSQTEVKPESKPDAEKAALNGEYMVTGDTYPVSAKLRELGEGHYDKARTVWVFSTKEKAEKGQKIVDDYAAQKRVKAA
jgi:hypothetical protein